MGGLGSAVVFHWALVLSVVLCRSNIRQVIKEMTYEAGLRIIWLRELGLYTFAPFHCDGIQKHLKIPKKRNIRLGKMFKSDKNLVTIDSWTLTPDHKQAMVAFLVAKSVASMDSNAHSMNLCNPGWHLSHPRLKALPETCFCSLFV